MFARIKIGFISKEKKNRLYLQKLKVCFFAKIKIVFIYRNKKRVSLQERGLAAVGGGGRRLVPRLGAGTKRG